MNNTSYAKVESYFRRKFENANVTWENIETVFWKDSNPYRFVFDLWNLYAIPRSVGLGLWYYVNRKWGKQFTTEMLRECVRLAQNGYDFPLDQRWDFQNGKFIVRGEIVGADMNPFDFA